MNLLDLIFPRRCVDCGALGSYVCGHCVGEMPGIPSEPHICSLVEYKGSFERVLKAGKYGNYEAIVRELVDALCTAHHEKILKYITAAGVEECIPVPLHKNRVKDRGFNQSAIIGRRLCRDFGLKMGDRIVTRSKDTSRLAGMSKTQRGTEIRGAFAIERTVPKRCLIVDDVFTTGATLRELERSLLLSGAEEVFMFTLARRWYNEP